MLKHLRVLDLTDKNGWLCGRILADLGSDVILVERPGSVTLPEKNLWRYAYNANKRSVTLDIETEDGRSIFRELVKTADFIIESFPPGYLGDRGLSYENLSTINPDIIMASITPFGQSGPYRDYRATDIVSMGMSGILYLTGEADRPPLRMNIPQACLHAGADAAAAVMIAYHHREMTGEGQHVDISLQHSAAWFLANAIPFWELNHIVSKRSGTFRWSINSSQRQVWECRDGYVFFNIIGGKTGAKTLRELAAWMDSEGMVNDYLNSMDWDSLDMFKADQAEVDCISQPIETFFHARTKNEIARGAMERNISICPLSSMADLYDDEQLRFRDLWTEVEYPEIGSNLTMPKGFLRSTAFEQEIRRWAPFTGEHNAEVYNQLGLTVTEIERLKETGVI